LSNALRKGSLRFLFLIVDAQPITQALPTQLERLAQLLALFWFQDWPDALFTALKNSFRLAQVNRALIRELAVDLLQNGADLLFLLRR